MKKFLKAIFLIMIFGVICCNSAYADEVSTNNKTAEISIGEMEIEKFTENQEIILPVKITGVESLCGGTIGIDCNGLSFVGLENENRNLQFVSSVSEDSQKLMISFSGTNGLYGDIDLVSLKFTMPGKMENNSNITIELNEDTNLVTTDTVKYEYTLKNGEIHIVKGNTSSFNFMSIAIIGLAVIGVALIVFLVINRKK